MSVFRPELSGDGYAVTLTVKDCPPTSAEWSRVVSVYLRRLKTRGMIRYHWVTEMQKRGVPHLHLAVWFPSGQFPYRVAGRPDNLRFFGTDWLYVAREYKPGPRGQFARRMLADPVGWFAYVCKHIIRGINHYQRSPDSYPKAWRTSRGRAWGRGGDWPTVAPDDVDFMGSREYWKFRRRIRRWSIAASRLIENDKQRARALRYSRRLLQHSDPVICRVRGLRIWAPGYELARGFLLVDKSTGAVVESVDGELRDYDPKPSPGSMAELHDIGISLSDWQRIHGGRKS